jgi:glycosyltransferase involved in cell wall biosynthesis
MINIIVPCYNEASRINIEYWRQIVDSPYLRQIVFTFVDDGSSDDTQIVIQQLSVFHNVEILSLKKNFGKANAIRFACLSLIGKKQNLQFFGFIDSDSAFKAEEVIDTLSGAGKLFAEYDAIFLSRIKMSGTSIVRSPSRHFIGRIIYTYIARGWKWAPYDTQCGFKLFNTSLLMEAALEEPFETKWFFDIELTARLTRILGRPVRIKELPLMNWRERAGSHLRWYHSLNVVREIIKARKIVKVLSNYSGSD